MRRQSNFRGWLRCLMDARAGHRGVQQLRCPTWSECLGVWRVPRQHCCRGACQIVLSGTHDIWDSAWSCCETIVFYPRPVLAFGYCHRLRLCVCVSVCVCVCVSPCVNHLLVRAITRDPFKLGSPNLDQRCKRPWLRSLLFLGVIDLDLQGQI